MEDIREELKLQCTVAGCADREANAQLEAREVIRALDNELP
jgi:hypothetical protein